MSKALGSWFVDSHYGLTKKEKQIKPKQDIQPRRPHDPIRVNAVTK